MQTDLLNGSDPLDQLRPIIMPEHDASWWPLAPGWWALMGLLFITLILIWWLTPKILARQAEKKRWQLTHSLLENLYIECRSQSESSLALQHYLQTSNAIFKRAVHYFLKDPAITSLTGKEWVKFLNKVSPQITGAYAYLYEQQLYAKSLEENIKLEELHHWACSWVIALKKQSKNIRQLKTND